MLTKDNGFALPINLKFPETGKKYAFAFITLFIILISIYSNSFQGEWHFDDLDNIVNNSNVHLKSLAWQDIQKTFSGLEQKGLSRPFSYLSLALNYYFDGLNVVGYHVVNFIIHYFAALFLFLFIYNTLKLPALERRYERSAYSMALLSTFFWATSPVQVSSITYIVQRMASMAGLFYIMSMYFYLKGRLALRLWNRIVFFTLCVLSAILSFGTKENAAMLPVTILLYDLFLIQGITKENIKRNLKLIVFPVLVMMLLGLLYTDISSLFSYSYRPFTMAERLLTEPRVIMFYISLLLYPLNARLMLNYDIDISTSLFSPWTTIPAILSILFLLLLAVSISKRKPLLSFCVIFFFLNHIIEGSFFALELIYEHRNYIPSMLIFVPIAIFAIEALHYFSNKRLIQFSIVFCLTFLIFAQGHTVYMRNNVFRTDRGLWLDNVKKAPNLSRPHTNLGVSYFGEGKYDMAFIEFSKAMKALNKDSIRQPAIMHHNLGTYYTIVERNLDKALYHYQQALDFAIKADKGMDDEYNCLAQVLLMKGMIKEAKENAVKAIKLNPQKAMYRNSYALIFLKEGNYDGAIRESRAAIKLNKDFHAPFAIMGAAYRLKGDYLRSMLCWQNYIRYAPDNMGAHLALIELYNLNNRKDLLAQTVVNMLYISNGRKIADLIEYERLKDATYVPEREVILPIIQETLRQIESQLNNDQVHK